MKNPKLFFWLTGFTAIAFTFGFIIKPNTPLPGDIAITATATMADLKIGTQTWTTKNLNVTKFKNGVAITQANTAAEWESLGQQGKPAWCYYDFSASTDAKYGKFYNWFAVNDARGLAPAGYHIPTKAEFDKMLLFLRTTPPDRSTNPAGKKLKLASAWPADQITTPTNGFNALPAGRIDNRGSFLGNGYEAGFWSKSQAATNTATLLIITGKQYFNYGPAQDEAMTYPKLKTIGHSVRCIKD